MVSRADYRAGYYAHCGTILAQLATEIGQPIPVSTVEQWSSTLSRLSVADDASEIAPDNFRGGTVLEILGLDPSNSLLATAADTLVVANRKSHSASSIRTHFDARAQEAKSSADLLRYQSPEHILRNRGLWRQLSRVAIAGVYLDSLLDAREDSLQLAQFSARQLAFGATVRLAGISARIHARTWRGFLHIARQDKELTGTIKGKIISLLPV
jgi:hypothetical protein